MVSQIKSLSQCNLSDGIRDVHVTKGQGLGISPGYYEHDSQKIDPPKYLRHCLQGGRVTLVLGLP